ncbi:MAG: acyl-CoA dehydrogenase family protein [Lentisphaeria bacterium]|nr:acyl-CoA dehydrogenase family protein [Lentisphaeria bacterium]MBR4076562.1 acyl-CoA dehydrogenase family protein [Lentisphaeria bacterium]
MSNFFTDNKDLQFTLKNINLQEVMDLKENGYTENQKFEDAPLNYEDALDSFERVLDVIGDITGERIAPRARQVDEEGPKFENGVVTYHPLTVQNLKDLRAAGVMGVMLPREYGGLNYPNTIYTMMTEMVSRADASLQNLFGLQDIAETIYEFGSDEQRAKYLPAFATGEADGSMDLTEPDSGSDLQSVRLRATQDENGNWFLDGNKRFITNGCSQTHLVLARSEEGTSDGRGLSMFICSKCPELVVRRIEHKMGIHGVATAELQYNHVPAELCGKRKMGLIRYVMSLMNGARVAISAQALGIAEAAYREARQYASEREQFKVTIDNFPPVYDMLARMKAKLTASRALLYETTKCVDLRTCYVHRSENPATADAESKAAAKYYTEVAATLTPMSKAMSTESANQICYDNIQIHGGTGYMHDFDSERLYRDVRITNIYEGTTQLQVVAAIGGVMKRSLDKMMNELFEAIPETDFTSPLKAILKKEYDMQHEAVNFITEKKDPDYHNLRARSMVENETFLFVGLLLLRDALKDADREAVTERYILDGEKDFERNYKLVMSDDRSVMEKHRSIIDY